MVGGYVEYGEVAVWRCPARRLRRDRPPGRSAAQERRRGAYGGAARRRLTAYTEVWQEARKLALTPAQFASPLARRPYDLRHAAVSLWLNVGVPAPDVAERAGHGVDVLLRVYAKCLDGQQEIANKRIEDALPA
ncbi:hypothetical protein AB0M50_50100 [Nonomuraea fuscirosea]|uniref:hypothetical protein n=1 Tax=Nonomuraea fuscirosea TaxID=1291556 RepID=UPI003437C598